VLLAAAPVRTTAEEDIDLGLGRLLEEWPHHAAPHLVEVTVTRSASELKKASM
jgi:hypothetical protein